MDEIPAQGLIADPAALEEPQLRDGAVGQGQIEVELVPFPAVEVRLLVVDVLELPGAGRRDQPFHRLYIVQRMQVAVSLVPVVVGLIPNGFDPARQAQPRVEQVRAEANSVA